MTQLYLIWWIRDAGLQYSIQRQFTIEFKGQKEEDVIGKGVIVTAKWHPGDKYAAGHKGEFECLVLAKSRKYSTLYISLCVKQMLMIQLTGMVINAGRSTQSNAFYKI